MLERRLSARGHMPEVPAIERRDAALEPFAHDAPADVGHAVRRETEVLEDRPGRRRRTEVVESDDRASVADPALPTEGDADLDAHALADVRRKDGVAIRLVLRLETLPHRQRHDAARDAFAVQRPRRHPGDFAAR